MDVTKCPSCGKSKKAWFKLCYECSEKEKQKPTCKVCGVEVPKDITYVKNIGLNVKRGHWQYVNS